MRKLIAKTILFPGLIAAAVLLSCVGAAQAYTYLGAARMGDMVVGSGLRSYAMGGTGIGGSDEAATILYNPATMNWAGPKQMTLAFAYAPVTERTVRSDKKSYYNENASFALNNFAILIPTPDGRFGFGLAYAPLNDYNYRHKQILYSITSPATRTGYKEVLSDGSLNRITPAVSFKFADKFAVGLSYSMLSGALNFNQKEIDSSGATDIIVYSSSSNRSVSGSRLDFGAVYSGLAPLRLGIAYYGATTLTMKSGSVEANMDMPAYIGLGVAWDFGGRYNTKLAFDFTPIPFSSAKINSAPSGLSDISVLKIGFEHWVREDVPLRFGYYSMPFYADKKIELVAFTFGSGYKLSESVFLDFAGEYGKRNYIGDSNFFDARTTIDETLQKLMCGVNYKW